MLSLIIKRILLAIPVLWIVASITFLLVRIVPGGPFEGDKSAATRNSGELESQISPG